MIPLKDSSVTRRFPIINISLIFLNIYLFLKQVMMTDPQLQNYVITYGLIPGRLFGELSAGVTTSLFTLISYQFLHGGWLHIGSNMLYLWVFGDNIEDRLGHFKYLIFYLFLGVLAGFIQAFLDPDSLIPVIGASGAVAGILGAYMISCPRARVLTLVPIFFFFTIIEVPAVLFLGFWFILQLFSGIGSIGAEVSIAWWAHIGGFVFGLLLVGFFGKKIDCE